jgi:hypothetical protein
MDFFKMKIAALTMKNKIELNGEKVNNFSINFSRIFNF